MTREEFRNRVMSRAEHAGVTIPASLLDPLEAYFRLLHAWNRRINLTALDLDLLPAEAVDRLFIEPVAAARYAPREPRTIDVGSGGGSPAIPFALAAGATALTMVESKSRKSVFLREAGRAAGMSHVNVETARVEDLTQRADLQAAFDVLTLRAVRADRTFVHELKQFLKPEGTLLLFRPAGGEPAESSQPGLRLTEHCTLAIVPAFDRVPRGT